MEGRNGEEDCSEFNGGKEGWEWNVGRIVRENVGRGLEEEM